MANLNLSEFTEKLFVADADHTFIWDTQNAISKRVSRNSWLNSGTLTSDAPVTISQTWNQIGTAFTAFKVNAVSTASATGSLLADFQVGGVSQFSVSKVGAMVSAFSITSSYIQSNANFVLTTDAGAVVWGATPDTWLRRDGAANTLALRNGAAAQTFNVYGTSSASNANYARLALTCGLDGNATISTQALGTGTAGVLAFSPGNSERMRITAAGNVGIGTTAPAFKLVVEDASLATRIVVNNTSNATNGAGIAFTTLNSGVLTSIGTIRTGNNGTLSLWAGTTAANEAERLTILAAGNVGIGTTSPTSKLQVSAGDVEVDTIAKGVILKSPDGTRYRVTVANGGTLSVAAV